VIDIVTVCIPHLQKNIMYIIMQIKQFSNIEEYVKCVLQIFVPIIFNQYIICIHFLLENLTENS
jgi:hypothetical protein